MLRATFEVSPPRSAGIFTPLRRRVVGEDGATLVPDGGEGLLVLLGSRAHAYPGGLEAAVRRAVAAL